MSSISLDTFYSDKFIQKLASLLQQPYNQYTRDEIISLACTIIQIICCELNGNYVGHQGQCINYAYYFLFKKPMQEASYFEPIVKSMIEFNFMEFIAQSLQRINNARLLDDNTSQLVETYVLLCNILIYYGDESVLFR